MDATIAAWLPLDQIGSYGTLVVVLMITTLTASLVAMSVPGVLVPISFSGGVLIGWPAVAAVAIGAAIGSHVLFLASRRLLRDRVRKRYGKRIEELEGHVAKHGAIYLVGMRITGVPHLLASAACALTSMRARTFALASAAGMLPAITLAALAGSAV